MPEPMPPERRPCAIMELSKRGPLRFLSHLDWARAMDRAVRRARLPVAYSEGFHPHAKISFGPPLPVGMEGLRELCLLDLSRHAPAGDLARALGQELPPGMELVSLEVTTRTRRSPLGEVSVAGYETLVTGTADLAALEAAVARLKQAREWCVTRATKSKIAEVDLRPGILKLVAASSPPRVMMELSLRPEMLVKPEEVLAALGVLVGERQLAFGLTTRTYLR